MIARPLIFRRNHFIQVLGMITERVTVELNDLMIPSSTFLKMDSHPLSYLSKMSGLPGRL